MEKIDTVLSRLKIEKVIWVDDIFETSDLLSDEDLAAFLQKDENAISSCKTAKLSTDFVNLVSDFEPLADSFNLYLQGLSSESNEAKLELSNLITNNNNLGSTELSSPQIDALSAIFGDKLIKCSFTAWPGQSASLMDIENAIFLVDLKNEDGANGLNGKDILQKLISTKFTGLVTMFTHDCDQDGEVNQLEQIRNELNAECQDSHDKLALLRIGVISKRRFQIEDIERVKEELVVPLHRLAMTSTFNQLAVQVSKALEKGIQNGIAILSNLPITDIDRVVFQNSMREGCSEIELIERLLSLTQREAVAKSLKCSDDLNNLLSKARDSWISSDSIDVSQPISKDLVGLRTLEIFDSDELINQNHSPLSNGDIFEYHEGDKCRQYVLLMSPCDSMVRKDGTRQLDTGVFVSFLEKDKAEPFVINNSVDMDTNISVSDQEPTSPQKIETERTLNDEPNQAEFDARLRYYSIPVNLDKSHKLDFMVSCPVVLDTLEWCVFNSDGRVRYDASIQPRLALLQGWQKRLGKLKSNTKINRCADSNNIPWPYRFLALKTQGFSIIHTALIDTDTDGKPKKGHMYFNLKRVKRLRSPYADAALSAFLNYSGRPAFEHEFLK